MELLFLYYYNYCLTLSFYNIDLFWKECTFIYCCRKAFNSILVIFLYCVNIHFHSWNHVFEINNNNWSCIKPKKRIDTCDFSLEIYIHCIPRGVFLLCKRQLLYMDYRSTFHTDYQGKFPWLIFFLRIFFKRQKVCLIVDPCAAYTLSIIVIMDIEIIYYEVI